VRLLGVFVLLAHPSIVRREARHDVQDDPSRVLGRVVPGLAQQPVQQLADGRDLALLGPLDQRTGHGADVLLGDALQERGPQIRHALGVGVPRPAGVALGESATGGSTVW
jgi:hypothetical protein